ncbi:hypothetical protein Kpol_1013p80 [Vanderwaltozyma polyspora DSM 70294]|uniref:PCI domain-containing protein n=1 Tax=Vanderwaltozyma polyspora (strain ATCC 22028 / DSM 70294 / BCRC 21397 / CBS 2163 / NBRC 10782 / NRRL Y-8283 / UCD 57-17) TaxID=436907 RepID=A7THC4_VANPO|nr:uncharacterized protein Kpol_1013p80 [Vanderwaltozyma polyspora DSM 70294]EDO18405.1 hypothetical protein Kpol_1013p80 [Vanderwaltozyma polyspora DSM 70294]
MSNSYNQVTPFKLGQKKKKTKTNSTLTNVGISPFQNPNLNFPPIMNLPPNSSNTLVPNPIYNQQYDALPTSLPRPVHSGVLNGLNGLMAVPSQNMNSVYNPNNNNFGFPMNEVMMNSFLKTSMKKATLTNNSQSFDLVDDLERKRKRAEKFSTPVKAVKRVNDSLVDEDFSNLNAISTSSHKFDKNKKIVGLCQVLEKPYLRLTSDPNPELVRPLHILKKTYEMLIKKSKKKETSYKYLNDQFKSMRQDLRVQMIENQFTVKVYQTNARLALENDDIGEFNQCQSRLFALYEKENIKPSNIEEFTCYKILYCIMTENNSAISSLKLKLLTKEMHIFANYMVRCAFLLAEAHFTNNYHQFFNIYGSLEYLSKKLVDIFISKIRLKSLVTISKSYNQISMSFLMKELQFKDVNEIKDFLKSKGIDKYVVEKNLGQESEYIYLDTKSCRNDIVRQYGMFKKIDIKGQQ